MFFVKLLIQFIQCDFLLFLVKTNESLQVDQRYFVRLFNAEILIANQCTQMQELGTYFLSLALEYDE